MTSDASESWDETVDVVVVGSGGGITGAYTAAREGLSVALVEASDKFGGTTAFSGGGGMWFPCNPVLRRLGVDDTIADARTYFHAVVGDRTPRDLQDAYVEGGARLVEYLEQDDSFAFKVLPWPDYFGSAPSARLDGMRHIVSRALKAEVLGPYSGPNPWTARQRAARRPCTGRAHRWPGPRRPLPRRAAAPSAGDGTSRVSVDRPRGRRRRRRDGSRRPT